MKLTNSMKLKQLATLHSMSFCHDASSSACKGVRLGEAVRLMLSMVVYWCMICNAWGANSTTINGVTWTYLVRDGGVSIGTGSSAGTAVPTSTKGSIEIPAAIDGYPVVNVDAAAFWQCTKLTSISVPSSVTNIGKSAFYGCTALTSVSIPSTVMSIGSGAFKQCKKLADANGFIVFRGCLYDYIGQATTVTIPTGVTSIGENAFSWKSSLTSVTIPGGVTNIGDGAFNNCSGLTSVSIPSSVTNIGSQAFWKCTGLTSVTIPNGVVVLGAKSFADCSGLTSVSIPSSVISIGGGAFSGCKKLADSSGFVIIRGCLYGYFGNATTVTIPAGVTSITDSAFYNNSKLKSVTIPVGVTEIGASAFYYCRALTSVNIPEGVTSIGASAFGYCDALTAVAIPSSVTSIGKSAFWYCRALSSLEIPSSLTNIGDEAFLSCSRLADADGFVLINGCIYDYCGNSTSVTIPDGVTSIGSQAFRECYSLETVTIPEGVTNIGASAFYACSKLKSVNIPVGVTTIGSSTFQSCSSLTSVTIPLGVTSIGFQAFVSCSELISATIPEGVTSIAGNAFGGCSKLITVAIPSTMIDIGNDAFSNCGALNAVYITDLAKWSSISFGNSNANPCNSGAKLFLNNEELTRVAIPETVTSIGNYAFYHCSSVNSISIPDSVASIGIDAFSGCGNICEIIGWRPNITATSATNIVVSDVVTSIAARTFSDHNSLVSITIPDSVTTIGSDVLSGCSNLKSINGWRNGMPANIERIEISRAVTEINDSAFSGCNSLVSLTIPDSVVAIGDNVFSGCTSLTHITFPDSLRSFGDNDLRELPVYAGAEGLFVQDGWVIGYFGSAPEEVTIPEGVIGIASYAFEGQAFVESIQFPSTLKYIGVRAFRECTSLEELELPVGLELIDDEAFRDCTWVQNVELPSSLTDIRVGAFANCSMLDGIECPNGLKTIGDAAFSNCWRMISVSLPASVDEIGEDVFYNCKNLTGVAIPAHVKTMAQLFPAVYHEIPTIIIAEGETVLTSDIFNGCAGVTEIVLSDAIEVIPDNSFRGCLKLETIEFPADLKCIGANAFNGLTWLRDVEIPAGVTNIGAAAFGGCSSIRKVMLPATATPVSSAFPDAYSKITELIIVGNPTEICNGFCRGCSAAGKIAIPSSVEKIGNYAFAQTVQNEVKFPDGLKSIGANAFEDVSGLSKVEIPVGVTNIGANAFKGCANIRQVALPATPTSVPAIFPNAYSQLTQLRILGSPTEICDNFCRGCSSAGQIAIPNSVERIGSYAFYQTYQNPIVFPTALKSIGDYAFAYCSESYLVIPNSVNVGTGAFANNENLASVSIPNSVRNLSASAFSGCANVREVRIPGDLLTMAQMFPAAYGALTKVYVNEGSEELAASIFENCRSLSSISLPQSILRIGAKAFKNCVALTESCIPNRVTNLANEAFSGCSGMLIVALPSGLISIGDSVFAGCSAFDSIVMPATLMSIGANVFNGCSALKSISYLGSCPEFDSACYAGTATDLQSYVVMGSMGWDGVATSKALPEFWPTQDARNIDYWTPNTFVATFNGNGGSPAVTSVVQTTGTTYMLPVDEPVMTGARFDGWWTKPVNGGEIKATTKVQLTRAQTLYAHWKYNNYTVRFDANGGMGEMDDQVLTVNTPAELKGNAFFRKDYRFDGWSLSMEGESEFADGDEVENLTFEQNAVVTLYAVWVAQPWGVADYLNTPGRTFVSDGDVTWLADNDVSHDGIGSMRSGAISAADDGCRTVSTLQTSVAGTGSVSFWWKVDCEPADGLDYFDYCVFRIDGVIIAQIAGKVDWEKFDYEITGEGEHLLEWEFSRDDWDEDESLYENVAWVDEFEWVPSPVVLSFDANGADGTVPPAITKFAGYEVTLHAPSELTKDGMVFKGWSDGVKVWFPNDVYTLGSSNTVLYAVWEEKIWTLEEAAGVSGLTIDTGGDADWLVDLSTNYDGVASIRSGNIGDNQSTWVVLNVATPGTISFRALVSGEFYRGKNCDYLKFEVDDSEAFSSYDANWSNVVVNIERDGSHTLKWTYMKNANKSVGYDCAWIDDVVWTPREVPADPIPVLNNPTQEEIEEVLDMATDKHLAQNITNETDYVAFREWASIVKPHGGGELPAGRDAVMSARNAWLSYALGSERLIGNAPTNGQMRVEKFEPALTVGSFDITVSIDDISVADEASEENLKKVFVIEGGVTLDTISAANVDVFFVTPTDGKVKFTARPNAGHVDAKTFFMRVKMTP